MKNKQKSHGNTNHTKSTDSSVHAKNSSRILIVNDGSFSYTNDAPKCVWGFVKTTGKKGSTKTTYHAPINFNKIGEVVDISDTRPYTAMQLNLNPLEAAFV